MKTIAFGVSALGIVTFTFVALLQIVSLDTRDSALRDNLQGVVEASLATAFDERSYDVDDADQLVADVVQGVALELDDPRAELDVTVHGVDRTLGLVSLTVTAHYPSVTTGKGREGTSVSATSTALLETVVNGPAAGMRTVTFRKSSGAVAKQYTLTAGAQSPPYPGYRPSAGKTFVGWKDSASGLTYAADGAGRALMASLKLDKDYVFEAVER